MGHKKKWTIMALSMFVASAANASVVYQWQSTSAGTQATTTGGELIVSNGAYRSGSASFDLRYDYSDYASRDEFPIQYFGLNFNGITGASINSDEYPTTQKTFSAGFTFQGNRAFVNSASLFGEETDFFITDGAVTSLNTLAPIIGSDYQCSGTVDAPCAGTGYFEAEVDPETQVPAPSSWGLFALAMSLTGLAALRRRKQGS